MTVNFTGIKNVGYAYSANCYNHDDTDYLNFQVTNGCHGDNDLDEFRSVLGKVKDGSKYEHKFTDGMVSLAINTISDFRAGTTYAVLINGKDLEQNDENLPLFQYLADVTKKLSEMDEKDFVVDEEFLNSPEMKTTYLGGLTMVLPKKYGSYEQLIKDAHDVRGVKIGAGDVNQKIEDVMRKYFMGEKK